MYLALALRFTILNLFLHFFGSFRNPVVLYFKCSRFRTLISRTSSENRVVWLRVLNAGKSVSLVTEAAWLWAQVFNIGESFRPQPDAEKTSVLIGWCFNFSGVIPCWELYTKKGPFICWERFFGITMIYRSQIFPGTKFENTSCTKHFKWDITKHKKWWVRHLCDIVYRYIKKMWKLSEACTRKKKTWQKKKKKC